MKQKKILFIGAGTYQATAMQKAKDMGHYVVAIDGNPDAEGFKIADAHYVQDVRDCEAAVRVAREHKVDGAVAIASEVCVMTVATVVKELGLPGVPPEVAKLATHKYWMRQRFHEHGLPCPRFFSGRTLDDVYAHIKEVGLPCVMKPVDDAGSRGVTIIHEASEIPAAFDHAIKNSRMKEVIFESFIEGIECTIEAMTYKGRSEILAVSDKRKPASKFRVATDLIYPPQFKPEIVDGIKNVAKGAIKALGIEIGPTHTEVIVTPQGKPVLVELAVRGGGFKVFSDVIRLVSGVDAEIETIRMALGEVPDITPKYQRSVILHFFAPNPGVLKDVKGWDQVRQFENTDVGLFKRIGEQIPELATDGSRTGYAISWGATRDEVVNRIAKIDETLKFIVE